MNAVFFDLDGTLIDSRADIAAAVNHTRRDLGMDPLPLGEVIAHVGQGAGHLFEKTIGRADDPAVLELYRGHYAGHMLDTTELYPGVLSTLEGLRERGWLLGINTAKPRFAVLAILEHFGIRTFFGNAVIAGGDCPEMKPSALPLKACAALMDGHRLSSADWMVGDSWTDMQCASNAGVNGAFCAFGFGQLRDSRFTIRLDRMDELLASGAF